MLKSLCVACLLLSHALGTSAFMWNTAPISWMRSGVGNILGGPIKLGSSLRSYVNSETQEVQTSSPLVPEVESDVKQHENKESFIPGEIPNLLINLIRPRIVFENDRNNTSIKRSGLVQTSNRQVDLKDLDNVLQQLGLNRNGNKPEDIVSQIAVVDLTPVMAANDRHNSAPEIQNADQKRQNAQAADLLTVVPVFKSGEIIDVNTTEPALIQSQHPDDKEPPTSAISQKTETTNHEERPENDDDTFPRPVYRPQSPTTNNDSSSVPKTEVVFQKRQGDDLSALRYHMFQEQLLGLQQYIRDNSNFSPERNDSDVMLSDQESPSPIYQDFEEYFMTVKNNYDNDSCVSLLICEISANPDKFGSYGQRVSQFFRNYQPASNRRASVWYKTVARLGFKSKSASLCRRAFQSCRLSMKYLMQLGETIWKKATGTNAA